jgi:hypothetical protein
VGVGDQRDVHGTGARRRPAARRALILDRLGAATAARDQAAQSSFAASLRGALVERWGEVALPCAPAFA